MCDRKNYTNSQIKALICEKIHSKRNRMVLFRRFVDGITYEKIGEEFGISTVQAKRIIYKAEKLLFDAQN